MNKIWYTLKNDKAAPFLEGVICVGNSSFYYYKETIQKSIDAFNRNVEWKDMWDLTQAKERLIKGDVLFIGTDYQGEPLAHVWFDKNYLYNAFVDPRRPDGYSKKFIQFVVQYIYSDTIELYCDDWNIKAQNLFEKVGFTKKYS